MKDINQIEVGKSLKEFLSKENISINQAAKRCNIVPSQMKNILDGKNYGTKFLFKIMNEFKEWEFSIRHFEHFHSERFSEPEVGYNKQSRNDIGLPIVPHDLLQLYLEEPQSFLRDNQVEFYYIPEFQNADFLLRIKSTDVGGKFNNGDIIACKSILKNTFIQWNKFHAINTNQGILVKRLYESTDKTLFLLKSENPEYEVIEIKKEDVLSIALIIGSIKVE